MNVNNASLEQNMALLASGQTTTTAEQLRAQQINEYMIEEGLSYVLDNEVARTIQEHMWDEQMQREMIAATYSVELAGASSEMMQNITRAVWKLSHLGESAWTNPVTNVQLTTEAISALQSDIATLLNSRQIGSSTAASNLAFARLTTGNADLGLSTNYLELLGNTSQYSQVQDKFAATTWGAGMTQQETKTATDLGLYIGQQIRQGIKKGWNWFQDTSADIFNNLADKVGISDYITFTGSKDSTKESTADLFGPNSIESQLNAVRSGGRGTRYNISSAYSWGTVGKSFNSALGSYYTNDTDVSPYQLISATSAMSNQQLTKVQNFLDSVEEAVSSGMSYAEWEGSASKYGISNLASTLEELGYTEQQLKDAYNDQVDKIDSEKALARQTKEEEYWDAMINYTEEWTKYYVDKQGSSTMISDVVTAVKSAERQESQDAVLALANSLASGVAGLEDPTQQQNALLAKILLVCEAIMQQSNSTAGMSLPSTLAGLVLNT